MIGHVKHFYEFGPFQLDATERQLLRDGELVALTPKVFDLLLVLVQNGGQTVEKDELMKRIWPDSFVEEANLSVNMTTLRRVLGESSDGHPYIVTIPRRGYRFEAGVREWQGNGTMAEMREQTGATTGHIVGETRPHQRRVKRRVLIVLAALAVAAIGVFVSSKYFSKTGLTEKDTILIADFDNKTGDEVFDGALKQGLAVQLEQSPFLNIFPERRIQETLVYMKRSPDERLTKEVAREICERQGITVMLTGSIASLGSHYVLNLEAANAQTGDDIARQQVEAESKEQVLQALGKASIKLREKLGESLSSIQKSDVPLEQVTTSSLEALKAFSMGRPVQMFQAIPFYKRAVELDPNFALAYERLATTYFDTGQIELAIENAQKAFALKERVSEREKFQISFIYYWVVHGDMEKSLEVLELWKQTYPRDIGVHDKLANQYGDLGRTDKAIEETRECMRLDPDPIWHGTMGYWFTNLNHFDEAKQVFEQALEIKEEYTPFHYCLYNIAFVQGDTAAMNRQIDWASGKPDEYDAVGWQARTWAFSGQLRKAREFFARSADMAEHGDMKGNAAWYVADQARTEAVFGDCMQAREAASHVCTVQCAWWDASKSALAMALCGEFGQAESITDELARRYPRATWLKMFFLPEVRAAIEIHRGNPERAVQLLEVARPYEETAQFWTNYLRGQAYLHKGAAAEAAAEFQKIIDHRGWEPASVLYPLAHLGLARAMALTGDRAKAQEFYQNFFTLWKDADADIPILQEAKREYEKLK